MFILFTLYWVSMLEHTFSKKIRNNIEEAPFGISGASTEPENHLRVKTIVEREIFNAENRLGLL